MSESALSKLKAALSLIDEAAEQTSDMQSWIKAHEAVEELYKQSFWKGLQAGSQVSAQIRELQNELDDAVSLAKEARSIDPNVAVEEEGIEIIPDDIISNAYFQKGLLELGQESWAEARHWFEQALNVTPHPTAQLFLGHALALQGHRQDGLATYQQVITSYPGTDEAIEAEKALAGLHREAHLAQQYLKRSRIYTLVGGTLLSIFFMWGISSVGEFEAGTLTVIPLSYYAVWAWYWGLKGMRLSPKDDEETGIFDWVLNFFLAYFYGAFGGGIRQYRIHRQVAQVGYVSSIEGQIEDMSGTGAQLRELLKRERYDEIISLISEDQNRAFELVKFFEDPDDGIRENAAETVARIGKDNTQAPDVVKAIMPRLLALLNDPKPQARSAATYALAGIAWNWLVWSDIQEVIEPAIPPLLELLNDSDAGVRKNAIEAIQVMSEWIEDKGGNVQQLTAAIPSITRCLKEEKLRSRAIWALRAIAHRNPEAVKPLIGDVIGLINDPKDHVRLGATATLRYLAEPYPALIRPTCSSFVALLGDPDQRVGQNAALILGFIAPEVPEIVERIMPKLTELLRDKRSIIREDAAKALAKIAEINPEIVRPAVEKLTELLKDPEESISESAAQVLQRVGYDREEGAMDLGLQRERLKAHLKIVEERLNRLDSLKEEIENLKATKTTVQQLDQRLVDNEQRLRELSSTLTLIKNQLREIERQVASGRSQARDIHNLLQERVAAFHRSRKRLWCFNFLLFIGIVVVGLFLFAPETAHSWFQTLSNWINDLITRIREYLS